MKVSNICRTCGEETRSSYATHLYEDTNKVILHQIEALTGLWLTLKKDMPVYVCSYCSLDIKQAIRFRERCIKIQLKFEKQSQADSNEKLSQLGPQKLHGNENNFQQNEVSVIENEIHSMDLEWNIGYNAINDENNYLLSICSAKSPKPDDSLPGSEVLSNQFPNFNYEALFKEIMHRNIFINRKGNSMNDNTTPLQSRIRNTKNICNEIAKSSSKLTERIEIKQQNISLSNNNTINDETNKNSELKQKNEKHKYICELCGKPYIKSDLFEAHVNRHKGENPYACDQCPEKFNAARSLRRHILKHTGILPYPCRHCDRHFLDHSQRMLHERIHKNIRPFQCTICEKNFHTKCRLQFHLVKHSGERAHRCEVCNRGFSQHKSLITHFKSAVHKQNEEVAKSTLSTKTDDFS